MPGEIVIGEIDKTLARFDPNNKLISGNLLPSDRIDDSSKGYWPNLQRVVQAASTIFKEGWKSRAVYGSEVLDLEFNEAYKLSFVFENQEIFGITTAIMIKDIVKCLNPGLLRTLIVSDVGKMDEKLREPIAPIVESLAYTHYYMTRISGNFNSFNAGHHARIYQTGVYLVEMNLIDAAYYLGSEEKELEKREEEFRPLRERITILRDQAKRTGELFNCLNNSTEISRS